MRIFTLDIETSPHKGYAFNVWQNNMMPGQIIKPTQMLTWSGKFLGEKRIYFQTYRDAHSLTILHELMQGADMIVTYNGDKFDIRHINREFIEAGLPPVRPFASMDLLKHVKKLFNFPHNRLDYVCSVLLDESKLETGGFDLWPAFMKGDEKAGRTMKRYNIQDVKLTEKLYLFIRPWIKNHPFIGNAPALLDSDLEYTCPSCGSSNVTRERPRRTRCFAIRVVNCADCGHWFDGKRRKIC